MLQRRNKVFEKYTLVSDKQKQFRSWRAWTIILVVASAIAFFVTNDWRWQLGLSVSTLFFGYQTYNSYNKWKDCQKEIEKTKLTSSLSQEFSMEKPATNVFTETAASSLQKNVSPIRSEFDQQRTPSNVASLRRRLPRGQIESMQSPDNNPENFSPDLAKKFARQAMQSPDKLSPMNTSRSSMNNSNRFSIFPTTPSMDQAGLQDRKPYHVSPLVTDTSIRRNISSAEPRRIDALQALGIGSIPDEWIEKLKGNLGAHLYAVLKLHDQSVQVIKSFLKQQQDQGKIPADALAKLSPLLNHEVTYKSVVLSDGTTLTIDNILQFCAQPIAPPAPANLQFNMARPAPEPGVSEDILQKYKAAWSFFKLCRHFQEIIQQRPFADSATGVSNNNNSANTMFLGMPFGDPASSEAATSSSHKTTLMERLRQLQSSDRKLRIEWQSMSFSRGGFGFGGGRNIRDFISGHQEYEMMDQDIVLALFLHRCDEHQSRIITASTSQPHKFSDMHFVTQAEDVRQLLQHHHQEVSSAFDGASSSSSSSRHQLRNGMRHRLSSAGDTVSRDTSSGSPSSQLLNIFLRNYPQPVEGDGAAATGGVLTNGSVATQASATGGKRVSPHYDLLRLATQVSHPSHMAAQQSWQQMSSMMASMTSSMGSGGVATPLFLTWFPQYKEILSIDPGRNDVFEAIIALIVIMTLTAPANELEEETARGSSSGFNNNNNSNITNDGNSDAASTASDDSLHHAHHHHHHNALHRIMSLLAGNRKAMMGSEDRGTVLMKLRRVFKLKGMGSGAATHARVVRSLFDEVVDVHELRHLMYDFHNLQQLQQQQSQQQQQMLSQSGLMAPTATSTSTAAGATTFSTAVPPAVSSATPLASSGHYSPLHPHSGGKSLGGGYQGEVGSAGKSPLMLLDGYGSGGLFDSHRKNNNHNFNYPASSSTPFRASSSYGDSGATPGGTSGSGGGLWLGASPSLPATAGASPLYSPPVYGDGRRMSHIPHHQSNQGLHSSTKSPGVSNGSSLGAMLTPITPRDGFGGLGGGGGNSSALRGFNSSFSTDMSFSSSMLPTAEKNNNRHTPFMMR